MRGPSNPAKVGDIWHRVDGDYLGDETYDGMALAWTTWRCTKTTPRGAWFQCVEWPYKKLKFALTCGARSIHRTKVDALTSLVARKKRHLSILASQTTAAQETLDLARVELAKHRLAEAA